MRFFVLFFFVSSYVSPITMPIWSKTGHRVIGEVAENYLSKKAKKELNKILGGQSLAAVSNYADFIKTDNSYGKFSPWHYVNYPSDKDYSEVTPSDKGDLIVGIRKCKQVLESSTSTIEQKEFYLKMLIHLIGDLHQPLHVGRLEDRGGNDIPLRWFGRATNLHKLWDSNMIDDYGMSYSELAKKLMVVDREKVAFLQEGTLLDWVEESQDIANEVYDSVEIGEKLGYKYGYKYWEVLENQLIKGGVRLAKVLNELYE